MDDALAVFDAPSKGTSKFLGCDDEEDKHVDYQIKGINNISEEQNLILSHSLSKLASATEGIVVENTLQKLQ